MNFLKKFFFLGLFIVQGILFVQLNGQKIKNYEPPVLFDSDSLLELTLKFNFDSLYNGGISETKIYPARLSFDFDDNNFSLKVELTKRGHFRKSFNVCDFPPLRMNFKRKTTKDTPFENLDKVKLVTHCLTADTTFEQYVIQEYIVYKAYNLLTERSFKVRLARITYVDAGKNHPSFTRMAFFIENPEDLAYRIYGKTLDFHYISPRAVNQYYYTLMSIFQYMIINQDWSVNLLHNVELVGIYPSLQPVPVPFDFDMAGLLNIPYKSPVVADRKGKLPERKFLPEKTNRKMVDRVVELFKAKKDDILNLYANDNYLDSTSKSKIIKRLDEFFAIIENQKLAHKTFLK